MSKLIRISDDLYHQIKEVSTLNGRTMAGQLGMTFGTLADLGETIKSEDMDFKSGLVFKKPVIERPTNFERLQKKNTK